MPGASASTGLKQREPRINVVVPARLRLGTRWSDACILNISSRGLLIHSQEPPARGSYVELRRGDQVIIGRVMWAKGSRAGLRSQDRVPVEAIVTSKASRSLHIVAPGAAPVERRKIPRIDGRSSIRGRIMQYGFVAALGVTLSITILSVVSTALAAPISRVGTALGGQASLEADSR